MPKWKKGATEFKVGVSYSGKKGIQTRLPKPIAQALGDPETITYVLKGNRVEIRPSSDDDGS